MSRPSLPQKIASIDEVLRGARIEHAFGGALALAYYAEPRTTIDVDVNVFVGADAVADVEAALTPLGIEPHPARTALARDGQARWRWDTTPIDLFFANDPIHEAMRDGVRKVPFGSGRIPILAPEHLLICKVAFDRPKDWIDIEQMLLLTPDIDRAEIERWLGRMLEAGDRRRGRLEALMD